MAKLKDMIVEEDQFTGGHRLCAGCGIPPIVEVILRSAGAPVAVSVATGCLEVGTTIYPYTSWKTPWIHSAFENAAATITGVETAYRSLKKQGKIEDKPMKFVAFGGDGGSYDIGLQSLSGALERGHDFLYVCYDNGAYMNTGVQRSSATPVGASTTTSPAGDVIPGKRQPKKDLTRIAVAHDLPYAAQTSPHNWKDLARKSEKALKIEGATFMNVISPCPLGWYTKPEDSFVWAKIAADTCYWPLYEVEEGVLKINYKPKEKLPITEWLKGQGRYKHLLKDDSNMAIIEEIQKGIDEDWERLLGLEGLRI